MIHVRYRDDGTTRFLAVDGHATSDTRVCAAVSAGLMTLHTAYGANRSPEEGRFLWRDWNGAHSIAGVTFFMRMVQLLESSYPEQIEVVS